MRDQGIGVFGPEDKGKAQVLAALQAEKAVLGALLFNNDWLDRLPPLEPGDFYEPAHGAIFARISKMIRAGKTADAVSVRPWWKAQPGAEEFGGDLYILALLEHAARFSKDAIDYAGLIAESRALRDLQASFRELLALVETRVSPADVVGQAEAKLRSMRLPGASEGRSLLEAAERFVDLLDDPEAIGLPTGLDALDRRLGGLYRGGLFLLAGRPSMGKTALATNIARNMASAGLKGHFGSYEMGDEQIAARSLAALSHREGDAFAYSELRKGVAQIDRDRLRRLARALPSTLIIEDHGAQTLGQLEASCRATARRLGGLDFVIVDYLQLMLPTTRGTRNDQITEISQGLKAMAKRLRVPVIALSQLSRANEQREDKRPQLSDLRDSGSLEQDADAVLGVYREHYYAIRDEPRPENIKGDKDRSADENYSLALHAWEQRCRACERTLEVITLKQRNGPVGTDVFEFFDKYDVARDRPGPNGQTTFRTAYQDDAL